MAAPPGRTLTRSERRAQRSSDLRLMVFATIAVLICMVILLVWMHMTQEVKGQLDRLNGAPYDEAAARNKMMKARIVQKRTQAEAILKVKRQSQVAVDEDSMRTDSRCQPLASWQAEKVPCTYSADSKEPPILVVTEHFGPPADFLLPHYDELGEWKLSLQEPTLWNIVVSEDEKKRQLHCAEPWLELTQNFDPLGSIPSAQVERLNSAKTELDLPRHLESKQFLSRLQSSVSDIAQADKSLPHPEQRLKTVFEKGMAWVIRNLVSKPLSSWEVHDIEAIHREVCAGEPDVEDPGKMRPLTQHVGFGFSTPPPLGFELPHLMRIYVAWLRMSAEEGCVHPVVLASDAFARLHRMQPFRDCNTRVSKIVLNAVLMHHGYAPLHMFLHTSKAHLKTMQASYIGGSPNELLEFFASHVETATLDLAKQMAA